MIIRSILQRFDNRISEAVIAATMVGVGVQVAFNSDLNYLAFRLINMYVGNFSIAFFLTFFGVLRLAAIVANGTWKSTGAWLRAIGAGVGAFTWSQLALSLYIVEPPDVSSLGGPIFIVFSGVEYLATYRALGMRDHNGRTI